mgnify:CR=1 FL=1
MIDWYMTVLAAQIAIIGVPGLPEAPAMSVGTDHVGFTYAGGFRR